MLLLELPSGHILADEDGETAFPKRLQSCRNPITMSGCDVAMPLNAFTKSHLSD